MLTRDMLPIETPCGVDFSQMTKREATRRFCESCRKHVHDLSSMTEPEARALLAAPSTDGLCVRYLADERGRIAFLPDVPRGFLSRARRTALAAAMLAAPAALTACMGAARPPEPVVRDAAGRQVDAVAVRESVEVRLVARGGSFLRASTTGEPPLELGKSDAFSGSCSGDDAACSNAAATMRDAATFADALALLRAAGFEVQ